MLGLDLTLANYSGGIGDRTGEEEELVFVLGQGDDESQVRRIIGDYTNTNAAQEALEETKRILG